MGLPIRIEQELTLEPVAYAVEHGDRTILVTIEGQGLQTLVLR